VKKATVDQSGVISETVRMDEKYIQSLFCKMINWKQWKILSKKQETN